MLIELKNSVADLFQCRLYQKWPAHIDLFKNMAIKQHQKGGKMKRLNCFANRFQIYLAEALLGKRTLVR